MNGPPLAGCFVFWCCYLQKVDDAVRAESLAPFASVTELTSRVEKIVTVGGRNFP
jgi:hypothetical protein